MDYNRWRQQTLLNQISTEQLRALEFGPLSRPVLKKENKSKAEVSYVDYADRNSLIELYKNDANIRVEDIVEIDYVLDEKLFLEKFPQKFDLVLASHVIEHVPNLIGWIKSLSDILNQNGIISLAVPDKRFTFDCQRNLSTPSLLVEAHYGNYTKPSPGQIYDSCSEETSYVPKKLLRFFCSKKAKPINTPQYALNMADYSYQTQKYINVHCWVWTPESFLLTCKFLFLSGLTDLKIRHFVKTRPGQSEFFVQLEKCPTHLSAEQRLAEQLESLPVKIRNSNTNSADFLALDGLCWDEIFSREWFRLRNYFAKFFRVF